MNSADAVGPGAEADGAASGGEGTDAGGGEPVAAGNGEGAAAGVSPPPPPPPHAVSHRVVNAMSASRLQAGRLGSVFNAVSDGEQFPGSESV